MDNTDDKDFDDFIRRQQKSSVVADTVDWDKERDDWIVHLSVLYTKIERFLSEYISSGQIQREYRVVRLDDEHIGSYGVRKMVLKIGRQQVDLVPVGTVLPGPKGRVDVIGPAGRAQILLVDSKASSPASLFPVKVGSGGGLPVASDQPPGAVQWEWRIVTRPPERRFVEITQQRLFDLIMEVANG